MKLFRTVSTQEFNDYQKHKLFRVAKNTLEGKQFFKTEAGVREFITDANRRQYSPPYKYLLIVSVDKACLKSIPYDEQELDLFNAVTVYEEDLPAFNKCIKFVEHYAF